MTLSLRRPAASSARGPRATLVVALAVLCTISRPGQAASLQETAQRLFPQSPVDSVEPTPIPGLYEVRAGKSVLYMDGSGRFVFVGELYDFNTRENLTAKRLLALNSVRFEDLPLARALHFGPAKATRRLAVFSDVDCPFCKKFHTDTLPSLLRDGVGVDVFLRPIAELHPQAEATSKRILCSPDPVAALNGYLGAGTLRGTDTQCKTALPEIAALADQLGIHGTPTFILDTGLRVDGFLAYDALMARWQTSLASRK